MGRPEKKPTDEQRKQVQTLSGYGLSQDQIARVLEIDRNTLAKHYAKELERGKDVAFAQATTALFSNIRKGKEASIFFYLKTQHGWRETTKIDATVSSFVISAPVELEGESWVAKFNPQKEIEQ